MTRHKVCYKRRTIEIWEDSYDHAHAGIGTLLCFRRSFARGVGQQLIRLPTPLAIHTARRLEAAGGWVTETIDAHLKGAVFEYVVYDRCQEEVYRLPGFFSHEDCLADAKLYVDREDS